MAGITTFPFLRAPVDALQCSEWLRENNEPLIDDSILPDWDPGSDIWITREVTASTSSVMDACGLGTDAKVRLIASWYSPITALRERAAYVDLEYSTETILVPLHIHIPGHRIAGELFIHTDLVLVNSGNTVSPLSPSIPGSTLWHEACHIWLEGIGARFPIEIVDFPPSLESAGWLLNIAPELDFPFLGGVRLNINGRNKKLRAAVESKNPSHSDMVISSMIYVDTARQLICFALESEEFIERIISSDGQCPFEENSTGYALWALLKQFFPEYKIQSLKQQYRSSPEHFDTFVQGRAHLLD